MTGRRLRNGQAAVQYLLMVAIASVAVLGVVQSRFNRFQGTMVSVKHDMAQVIGGSKRLPQRWYSKEVEDYSLAKAGLASQAAKSGAGAEGEAGATGVKEKGAGADGAAGAAGESVGAKGQKDGFGQSFYGGMEDSGFEASAGRRGASEAGELGGKSEKKKEASKVGFGGSNVTYEEGAGGGQSQMAGSGRSVREGKQKDEEQVAQAQKAKEVQAEGISGAGQVKKAIAGEEEEKKGGNVKLDWATIIKLILIIAIIVILVIMLLGSVSNREQE